jgi:hypothetical protein
VSGFDPPEETKKETKKKVADRLRGARLGAAMASTALNPFLSYEDAIRIREWYVWVDGGDAVGPVSADQIARGILVGKVPRDAQVARAGDYEWGDVLDSTAVVAALKAL